MEPALPSVTAAALVRPAEARPKDVPRWNFHKYLVGRDGYASQNRHWAGACGDLTRGLPGINTLGQQIVHRPKKRLPWRRSYN
jgi:hypothetical protein